MKIGTENKKQVRWMVALLAVLALVFFYNFKDFIWGGSASAHPSAPSAPDPRQKTAPVLPAADGSDPRLRLDVLEASRKIKLESGGRNPFAMAAVPVPTPVAPVRAYGPPAPPTPTPPPPPPPIPLKYYGIVSKPGEPQRIFLQTENGEQVFVAAQGTIVNSRYRVVQIQPNQVLMEDVLTKNQQPIPLTAK